MTKIRAVMLDLDGTLRDTRELIYEAYQHAILTHSGKQATKEEIKPHIHHHTVVHQAFANHVNVEDFEKTYSEIVDPKVGEAPLYDGTKELLLSLRQAGYKIAIVTSASQERADTYIRAAGLAELCDLVVGVTPDRRPKPAPDMLQEAMRQFDVSPAETVMLGDMTADVEAAKAASVPCVAVTHGFGTYDELRAAGAVALIDSLGQFMEAMRRLEHGS